MSRRGAPHTRRVEGRHRRQAGLTWPVAALLALTGAWLGHLVEYIRVSGWHAGWVASTTSVHAYFFPAGIGLLLAVAGVSAAAGRLWRALARRLSDAETARWAHPARRSGDPEPLVNPAPRLAHLWLVLSVLQLVIWVLQENLEAVAADHRAPLLGVLSGVHMLAPVVQAEVALMLASVYCLVCRRFGRLEESVRLVEQFIARRWARATLAAWSVLEAPSVAVSPLDRWGAQRWQRPPPGPSSQTFSFS